MTQNDERRMRMTDGEVSDDLNRPEMEAEDLMLGMRLARGVSDNRVEQAAPFLPDVYDALDELVQEGYLTHEAGRWIPTRQGWLCGNDLFERLLDLS
jgi:oxygen-independent coproporphyrinogen-3 oxidase